MLLNNVYASTDAADNIIRNHSDQVMKYLTAIGYKDPDIRQSIYLHLLERIHEYNCRNTLKTFIFQWSYNFNRTVSHKNHKPPIKSLPNSSQDVLSEVINNDNLKQIFRKLDKLSPNDRDLYCMYLQGKVKPQKDFIRCGFSTPKKMYSQIYSIEKFLKGCIV